VAPGKDFLHDLAEVFIGNALGEGIDRLAAHPIFKVFQRTNVIRMGHLHAIVKVFQHTTDQTFNADRQLFNDCVWVRMEKDQVNADTFFIHAVNTIRFTGFSSTRRWFMFDGCQSNGNGLARMSLPQKIHVMPFYHARGQVKKQIADFRSRKFFQQGKHARTNPFDGIDRGKKVK
jgi:hypothetical protein